MQMRNYLFLLIITVLLAVSEKGNSQDTAHVSKKYFGLSLQPNFQNLITFAIVEVTETGKINRIFLSRQNWLHQIVGIQESVANPEEKNLMKDAGLQGPDILDEFWKLRYSEPPYAGSTEKGWAGKPTMPTEGQMEMLRQFGIKTISDYFYGENLFKLFKAMEDPGWVSEYQNK